MEGVQITTDEWIFWQEWSHELGTWDARAQGLGGWTLSIHHAYDPVGRILYPGSGGRRHAASTSNVIDTVAGGGDSRYGDGGPAYHPPHHKGTEGSRVRLWIDGKLVIDSWDGVQPGKTKVNWWVTQNLTSGPISLTAGKRVPIKLEFSAAGGDLAHLHLYWESRNWDMRHIPGALLYPE